MRRYAVFSAIVLTAACLLPTPRERAMEEPDRFERFNALAELDSTETLQAWHPISDPTAALPGTQQPLAPVDDLRTRATLVRRYLAHVADELREQRIVHDDTPGTSWDAQFEAQMASESFSGWSIELWVEPRIDGGAIQRQIRCNVLGMNQLSLATIAPTLSIKKPLHGLRFDWFVATGDTMRNAEVVGIVKAHALSF